MRYLSEKLLAKVQAKCGPACRAAVAQHRAVDCDCGEVPAIYAAMVASQIESNGER